jgi:hypothetical protein
MSSHDGAASLPPVAAGGQIFYGKQGRLAPSVHEIRPGEVAESPESYPVSSQLSTYFLGLAVELATVAKPSTLFFRTSEARNSIYAFSYLDTSQGRRQDAWGRWDFASHLGVVIGMAGTASGLLVFTLRLSHDKVWVVADLCPTSTGMATYPYLDSIRPWSVVASNTGSLRPTTPNDWSVAFDTTSDYQFFGSPLSEQADLAAEFPTATGMWAGAAQPSYFVPTNPFVKDRKDQPVLTGRLTVTKLVVSYKQTAGFNTTVTAKGEATFTTFNGYSFGAPVVNLGRVPISEGSTSVSLGLETREYTAKLEARTWLPFNITYIEWVGQFFNNTQRLG